jgi:peptide-methionine (S)-S-oxide reductase
MDKVPGVISTVSGYSNGHKKNPSYRQVSAGGTGHAEVVQIVYDANRVGYKQLLDVFWRNIDPTVEDRQFCDRGDQYRSGIFYLNEQQRKLAIESRVALEKSRPFKAEIVTEITKAGTFYPAEDYHQDYYKKNPLRYKYYRFSCGRDKRLEELWGKKK